MNRTLLLIICDFLLLNLLALTRWEKAEPASAKQPPVPELSANAPDIDVDAGGGLGLGASVSNGAKRFASEFLFPPARPSSPHPASEGAKCLVLISMVRHIRK
jgi:hypothetical protein